MVLEKVEDLRYGENPHQRAAFYRETTHRTGTLADAKQLQGSAAELQQPARPRRGVPDRPRLHRADRRHRQAHRPGRAGLQRRARRGLPQGARDRPGGRLRRDRRGQPRARRGDRPGDRRQLVRGGRRARLQRGGARHPARQDRPRDPGGAGRPDRGDARLRHRQPRLQAGERRAPRRDPGRARDRGRPPPGGDQAPADARGADRPAVRLAGRPPRPVERDRARQERRHGRASGPPRPAARCRSRSPCAGPATGRG